MTSTTVDERRVVDDMLDKSDDNPTVPELLARGIPVTARDSQLFLYEGSGQVFYTPALFVSCSFLDVLVMRHQPDSPTVQRVASAVAAEHLSLRLLEKTLPREIACIINEFVRPPLHEPLPAGSWADEINDVQHKYLYGTLDLPQMDLGDLGLLQTHFEPYPSAGPFVYDLLTRPDENVEILARAISFRRTCYWVRTERTLNERLKSFWDNVESLIKTYS